MKIHSINDNAVKPKIVTLPGEALVDSWLEEVKFWQEEVAFYTRFLKLGLGNVPHGMRAGLENLRNEFEAYDTAILPSFATSLESLKQREEIEQDITHAVVGKLHKHRAALRLMKKNLFPLFSELFHCEIW